MKIGYNYASYNEERNFANLPFTKYKFELQKDLFTYLTNGYFYFSKRMKPYFKFLHYNPFLRKKKFHFFNGISFSHDFIVTFETYVPRLGNSPKWLYRIAVKRLASNSCKKIISMSECAMNIQVEFIKRNYPEYLDKIKSKLVTIHPSQSQILQNYYEKQLSSEVIDFTIIGRELFRKGGREVLQVFDQLISQFGNLRLNIVGELSPGDYATKSSLEDVLLGHEIINKHTKNIVYHKRLHNDKVLHLLKKSHVALLPTWGDTYGYSVLEAQAAGCPVITTNLRALPEINNQEIGWIIFVPKLLNGDGKINSDYDRLEFSKAIRGQLYNICKEIIENPSIIERKGILALKHIKDNHCPSLRVKQLEDIYTESFK